MTGNSRRIVVGVDESAGAAAALRWAVAESELDGAGVTALLAWDWLDQHRLAGNDFDPKYNEDAARQALAQCVTAALGTDLAARVETRVVCDLAAPALLDASEGSDLMVVGARGTGGFAGLLLGSVAQHCLHHASIPIAIIRPDSAAQPAAARIVVAVDGSATSQRALKWAIDEARLRSAQLDVVNAWQMPWVGYTPYGRLVFMSDDYEKESRRILDDAVAVASGDLQVNPVALRGAPVEGILDAATGASLLVVGSRGHASFRRALFGSVATQLSHHAPCPLVVVPPAASGR